MADRVTLFLSYGHRVDMGSWDGSPERYQQGLRRVLDATVAAIRDVAGALDGTGSPCPALPGEAWHEARLLTSCPVCRASLRVNPFVVDRRSDR